jgi:ABC-type uncharacterized transport system permease subunit
VIEVLFSLSAAAYALAWVLWVAFLRGTDEKNTASFAAPNTRAALLSIALLSHAASIAIRWWQLQVGPLDGIGPTLSTLALLIATALFVLRRVGPRMDVLAVFALPVAFGMLLTSRLGHVGRGTAGLVFVLHVASNSVGVTAATVACAVAVAYLVLERQVKARKLGTIFRRLPPLEALDQLSFRCVLLAIPALTVGIVTGHIVAARSTQGVGLPWQQLFAVGTWVVFVALGVLRYASAWRGRRAMIGTISGGAALAATLFIYLARR